VRKIAAAAVAIPFIVFFYLSSVIRRTSFGRAITAGSTQLLMMGLAVAVLVAGMLVALPAKQVAGGAPPTFTALAPQAAAHRATGDLALDVGYQVQFTKPMNEASVQNALTITPQITVKYQWDATSQVLSLVPDPHWEPHTLYTVDVSGAASDQEGLGLAAEVHTSFQSGSPTSGKIVATEQSDALVSPATSFQITFTRPVKLATVALRFAISPEVPVDVTGDDPTDAASQVFTIAPKSQLAPKETYIVSFNVGAGKQAATDSAGAALQPLVPITVTTMSAPGVVRFRPLDATVTTDPNQPVSVRFTEKMDEKTTAAAFSVTVNGRAVSGSTYWTEGDTVLVLTPRYSFAIGSTVIAKVGTGARSAGGLRLARVYTGTFKVQRPTSSGITTGGAASASSPWYRSEVYYLNLMNCTRTGGWVTDSGACSSETHHTLPSQGPLSLSAAISNAVSRPYAEYMAKTGLLDHYLRGTTPHSRLCAKGFCGGSWGENIGNGGPGMVALEIFYQNEYWCRCEHYYNIMNPYFHQAGIGVWVDKTSRVSIDFYG
jgi:hypothetical protein